MQRFRRIPDCVSIMADILGKNSEAFAVADPLTIDSNGLLAVASAGNKVIGYSCDAVTMSSTNQTVAAVKPNYIPAAPGVIMDYTADQAGVAADDVGEYADLTGSTGAIQMNLTAGSTGQFLVREIDPDGDGTTTVVSVEAAEPQVYGFAQS